MSSGLGFITEFVEPNVCVDENLKVDSSGLLVMQPWAVDRLVASKKGHSGNDGKMFPQQEPPGRLLIDIQLGWRNDAPIDQLVTICVTRASKSWITSNPNAIQFRDRWSYVIDKDDLTPAEPVTVNYFNGQVGSAIDFGTDGMATPKPGKQYMWTDTSYSEELVGPVGPGERINVWYRQYVWTPPPWSDNANKGTPKHEVHGNWAVVQLMAHGRQGDLITG